MTRKSKPKLNPAFTPRVRFNWGYHDAAHDHERGTRRVIVSRIPNGANPTRFVLDSYDRNYTAGYVEGTCDAQDGIYAGNSDNAWKRTRKQA